MSECVDGVRRSGGHTIHCMQYACSRQVPPNDIRHTPSTRAVRARPARAGITCSPTSQLPWIRLPVMAALDGHLRHQGCPAEVPALRPASVGTVYRVTPQSSACATGFAPHASSALRMPRTGTRVALCCDFPSARMSEVSYKNTHEGGHFPPSRTSAGFATTAALDTAIARPIPTAR